jgi:myo-inositol-1(or 4)-monophosphatase
MTTNWGDYLATATEAALLGGRVLLDAQRRIRVQYKSAFNLVTEADLEAQQQIHAYLARKYPGHAFLGEEEDGTGRAVELTVPLWIVDPLDGTTNYVHSFSSYCVSVGLEVGGELVVGVIYDPVRQELFRAASGQGAWLDNQQLQVSGAAQLEESLVAMEAPYSLSGRTMNADDWRTLSLHMQGLRQTGSTALDLAFVAAGRLDALWGAREIHPWDSAAGAVLVREAGGTATCMDGSCFDVRRGNIMASNGRLHELLVGLWQRGQNRGTPS